MSTPWHDADVTIDTHTFHYLRTGNGRKPPLLLLHGFSDNGRCWQQLAQDLEATYDVIMPDSRGHGRSARIQPGTPLDNAADADALINALGLEKPIVAGHSMGGLTATELGARYPHLAKAIILEDPAWLDRPTTPEPPQENPFFTWLQQMDGLPLPEVIAFGQASNPAWPEAEFPAWATAKQQLDKTIFGALHMDKPWRDFVSALAVPTLLITAEVERGAIITPALAQEATSRSAHLQIAHVPDAGHNIRRENYPAYVQAIRAFLATIN
ncbi:MAG: alpha/beta hydrolase [Chloroflexota bacterium]